MAESNLVIDIFNEGELLELDDGTKWQVAPDDVAKTSEWLPSTRVEVVQEGNQFCLKNVASSDDQTIEVIPV